MKSKNRWLILALILMMLLSACGSDDIEKLPKKDETAAFENVNKEYNPEWRLIEKYTNNRNGYDSWESYRYNRNGKLFLAEYRIGGNMNSGSMIQAEELIYDDTGLLIGSIRYENGEELHRSDIKCDGDGNIISEINEHSKSYFEYDENGNCIVIHQIRHENEQDSMVCWNYTYNENGDMVTQTLTQSDNGEYGSREVIKNSYNQEGELIRIDVEYYYGDKLESSYYTEVNYDSNMEYRYTYYANGELGVIEERVKNENEKLIDQKQYLASGECVWHYTYEYDNAGNLMFEKHYQIENGEEVLKEQSVCIYKLI